MGNNGLPLQMQYLGSKARIAKWIINEGKKAFPDCNQFFDVFSGTGTVAFEALDQGYKVSANDFEGYSFCIIKSLLSLPRSGLDQLITELSNLHNETLLLNKDRLFMKELFEEEKEYFKSNAKHNLSWESYREFCEKTPIIDGTRDDIDKLRTEGKWNLFSCYYANTYFGIRQCLQLDTIRELAEKQDEVSKTHLQAATIAAMTYGVSSTTHLAQYLRPTSKPRAVHLIERRQFDFIDEVQHRLLQMRNIPLSTFGTHVYKLDYISALKQENPNSEWIVYADPPYFKEHYSRYYHVLNTFYLYDFPYLTFNPITKKVTEGRYRLERNTSDFGKRGTVVKAFTKLFSSCKEKRFKLMLSYAETSLVKKNIIIELSEEAGLKTTIQETELMHSSQGKYANKTVQEYLFCFEP